MESVGPTSVASVMCVLLLAGLLSGCIHTEMGNTDKPPSPWPPGTAWTYDIQGSLPAKWMNAPIDEPGADGMLRRLPIDTTATYAATINEDVSDRFEDHWPRTVMAGAPEAAFLGILGFPFDGEWRFDGSIMERNGMEGNGTKFFDFPLKEGKLWNTEIMGQELLIEVRDHRDGFQLQGMNPEGRKLLEYTWSDPEKWFGEFRVFEEDGTEVLSALLSGPTRDIGNLYLTRYYRPLQCSGSDDQVGAGYCGAELSVPDSGVSMWWIDVAYENKGAGSIAATKRTPGGIDEIWFQDLCPCSDDFTTFEAAARPGNYSWIINHGFVGEWDLSFSHLDACFARVEAENGRTAGDLAYMEQC